MHPFLKDQPDQHAHIHTAWERGVATLGPSQAQLERGLALHHDAVALDNFGFLPMVWTKRVVEQLNKLIENQIGGKDFHFQSVRLRQIAAAEDPEGAPGQAFVAALRASGLSGSVITVGAATIPGMNWLEADLAAMAGFIHNCRAFRQHMTQVGSREEMRDAKKDGRFGIVWSCNSPPNPGRMIDPDDELANIAVWHRLGFRLMHVTYNRRNVFADGGVEETDGGVSAFGEELIKAMNRVGMIVDVPHSSRRTVLDAARLSEKPMMCSHAGCNALFDHHRNKTDEELKAVADSGGVFGVVGLAAFLGHNATINTLLDHVDHAVKLIGAEHVAIGTDNVSTGPMPDDYRPYPDGSFNGRWPGGWSKDAMAAANPDETKNGSLAWTNWPLFTVGLVMRGYGDDQIRSILGENLMRVMDANRPTVESIELA